MTKKKKATNPPVKKAAVKKVTPKKAIAKKKTPAKKSTAPKKNTVAKKASPVKKKITSKKTPAKKAAVVENKSNQKNKQVKIKKPAMVETNQPPIEEKSNEIPVQAPGMNKEAIQQAAVRNYDKHQIRLSSVKKGGPKPTGKKPLW